MAQDYGDSWAQGQRCYFSFELLGVSGIEEEEDIQIKLGKSIDGDAGYYLKTIKNYIPATLPFNTDNDEDNKLIGSGLSETVISESQIKIDSTISFKTKWLIKSVFDKADPDDPYNKLYKQEPVKIQINQIVKVSSFSTKTISGKIYYSFFNFLGIVESISQSVPTQKNTESNGYVSIKIIYIFSKSFDSKSPLKYTYINPAGGGISNYEYNEKYCCKLSKGLTNTTTGKAYILLGYNLNNDSNVVNESYSETRISQNYTQIIGYSSFISYNGDIDSIPFENVSLSANFNKSKYTQIGNYQYSGNKDRPTSSQVYQNLDFYVQGASCTFSKSLLEKINNSGIDINFEDFKIGGSVNLYRESTDIYQIYTIYDDIEGSRLISFDSENQSIGQVTKVSISPEGFL